MDQLRQRLGCHDGTNEKDFMVSRETRVERQSYLPVVYCVLWVSTPTRAAFPPAPVLRQIAELAGASAARLAEFPTPHLLFISTIFSLFSGPTIFTLTSLIALS